MDRRNYFHRKGTSVLPKMLNDSFKDYFPNLKLNSFFLFFFFAESINFVPFENCKGVIQVNYQNKPEKVCLEEVPPHLLNDLCGTQDCGQTLKLNKFNKVNHNSI